MIAFTPDEDQKMMQDSVAQFARTTLRPRLREFEAARAVPEDVRKTAHEMGLGLVALPSELGGAGLGLLTAVLVEEEVAGAVVAWVPRMEPVFGFSPIFWLVR